jgi:hypothetical protein
VGPQNATYFESSFWRLQSEAEVPMHLSEAGLMLEWMSQCCWKLPQWACNRGNVYHRQCFMQGLAHFQHSAAPFLYDWTEIFGSSCRIQMWLVGFWKICGHLHNVMINFGVCLLGTRHCQMRHSQTSAPESGSRINSVIPSLFSLCRSEVEAITSAVFVQTYDTINTMQPEESRTIWLTGLKL